MDLEATAIARKTVKSANAAATAPSRKRSGSRSRKGRERHLSRQEFFTISKQR